MIVTVSICLSATVNGRLKFNSKNCLFKNSYTFVALTRLSLIGRFYNLIFKNGKEFSDS